MGSGGWIAGRGALDSGKRARRAATLPIALLLLPIALLPLPMALLMGARSEVAHARGRPRRRRGHLVRVRVRARIRVRVRVRVRVGVSGAVTVVQPPMSEEPGGARAPGSPCRATAACSCARRHLRALYLPYISATSPLYLRYISSGAHGRGAHCRACACVCAHGELSHIEQSHGEPSHGEPRG